jgi:transposase-like protein
LDNDKNRKPPMNEDRQASGSRQGIFNGTAETLREHLRGSVREALKAIFEEEIRALCGERYRPDQSEYQRAGSAPSYVITDASREAMDRPRVRRRIGDEKTEEVALKSWKLAQSPDEWESAMMRAILCGVSTRSCKGLRQEELLGESRSAISRLWQRKSVELVEQMQQSDLSAIHLVAMMLDGVVLAKDLVATVALGIDEQGIKHVLGFRVGSSENQEVCRDLLSNLRQRGLTPAPDRYLLGVLDGSKALERALLEVFPHTLIQRCLVHKERNLKGYLSHRHWGEIAQLFNRLRRCQGSEAAREVLDEMERFLSNKNQQAKDSLNEAGSQLLTLLDLEVPNTLNRSLLSTNCIENLFKNLRRHIGKVCRWREQGDQADRWLASGLMLASQGFRKIGGHEKIPSLIEALEKKWANERTHSGKAA